MMEPEVVDVLHKIQNKEFTESLCQAIYQNEKPFLKMGISADEVEDLLEIKWDAEDYPSRDFYGVYDYSRASYISDNMSNPAIKLHGFNERSFYAALRSCEVWRVDYERKAEELSILATRILNGQKPERGRNNQKKPVDQKIVKGWLGKGVDIIRNLLPRNNVDKTAKWKQGTDRPIKMADKREELLKNIPGVEKTVANVEFGGVAQHASSSGSRNIMLDMAEEEDYDKLWVFTGEQKIASDGATVLNRIKSNRYLYFVYGIDVPKGELGGWIESEKNLEGYSWVGEKAEVFGHAKVVDSVVIGNAIVRDNARVENESCVAANAQVTGSSMVKGKSGITGNARIGDTSVVEKTRISGYSSVSGHSYVKGCTCNENVRIVDSGLCNTIMTGDIYVNSYMANEESLKEIEDTKVSDDDEDLDWTFSESPKLINSVLMDKLRANQEEGLKKEVILSAGDKELIADLSFVKDEKSWPMKLLVSNPVIRYDGIEYGMHQIVDKLNDLGYPMEWIQRERMSDMITGISHLFGDHNYVIQQVDGDFVLQDEDCKKQVSKANHEEDKVEKATSDILLERSYNFTGREKIASDQVTVLHEICANQDLSFRGVADVCKGTVGGWIESEDNLNGCSWIGDNAEVYGSARVVNSVVMDNSIVRGLALVEDSTIKENAEIMAWSVVLNSVVGGQVQVNDFSVIDGSTVDGYGYVAGESYLQNCICRKNTRITDSWLQNVRMEGDFKVAEKTLDFKKKDYGPVNFDYHAPAIIVDSILDKLRAHQDTGLEKVALFGENGKEFIANLALVEDDNMRMKLAIHDPVIRYNGVSYDGQKIIDQLKELGYDMTEIHLDKLSAMLNGRARQLGKQVYVIQQKEEGFELVDARERITNVDVYPVRDGGMAIRCMVDGVQQSAIEMKDEDARIFGDETDKRALAVRYFGDEFVENKERAYTVGR